MNEFTKICCGAAVLFGLTASAARADEKVDNPTYQHWAQFKPGSYSVLKTVQTVTVAGREIKTETTLTTTLKELSAEKALVEMEFVTVSSGRELKLPAQKMEIPAKITKVEFKKQEEPEGQVKVKEGKEVLKVAGKTIKTTWAEIEIKQGKDVIKTKSWTSEEIPGQVVKTVQTMEGKTKMTSEGLLVRFKADKK
jgi:hypothetical protein